MIQFLYRATWFIALLLIQGMVLDRVHFYGYATPVIYSYFILMQGTETPRKQLMLQAFFLGLCVDTFSNTPGLNSAAATFLAFVRSGLLRMQTLRGMSDEFEPTARTMGGYPFLRYIASAVFIHILLLHLIDAFSFFRLGELWWKTISDTLITTVCIWCIDMIRRKQ